MADIILNLAGALGAAAEPTALGLKAYNWVSIAMLVLVGIFLWKKVPGMVTGGLDNKIAAIREQLDEARQLREEAEKLRDEYVAKIAGAEKDAEAMVEGARREADHILEKAEADSKAMVERRKKMAEEKIAAAERDAIEDVRNRAALAATAAARKLIAEKHDASADRKLADEVIGSI